VTQRPRPVLHFGELVSLVLMITALALVLLPVFLKAREQGRRSAGAPFAIGAPAGAHVLQDDEIGLGEGARP